MVLIIAALHIGNKEQEMVSSAAQNHISWTLYARCYSYYRPHFFIFQEVILCLQFWQKMLGVGDNSQSKTAPVHAS